MNNKNIVSNMISLIIPVYNRQEVVEECIRSVQNQTYQQFEILLIDDGSTDNTLAICKALAKEEPRIKLLTTEHVGVSAARNIGLETAAGEYIFFLDSDDIIHPMLLEALATGLETHGAVMAGTRCRPCREEDWAVTREAFVRGGSAPELTYHGHQETVHAVFCGESPFGMIGGVLMRREWVGNTRFRTDLTIGEDFYFLYENLIKGADAVFLKQRGYLARIHAGNTSWQYDYSGFWTRFYRRKLVWESEEALGRPEYANRQKHAAFGCFMRCFRENKPYSANSRKMCAVLKEYKREVFPALGKKTKIVYLLSLFCPAMAWMIIRVADSMRKGKRRIQMFVSKKGFMKK